MALDLIRSTYNPDVLTCLANLSSDEVFTPPEVVNQMLDMLPQELFSNPDTTFLDPATKSGVFLREIAKRLMKGLEQQIPDLQERVDHIFQKQLFGIAITELTSLLARRSLYCSKYPNSSFSVTQFALPEGNIRYRKVQHSWSDGKCVYCGASQSEYDRSPDLETHAYECIHTSTLKGLFDGMQFDVIISNPPYQLSDGGAQASAKPIYQYFVQSAKRLNPRYISMIIPARWYAGGKGLDEFRDEMLTDTHITELHDFPNTDDCFPGVNIRGGVCYFLWDRSENRDQATVVTHIQDTTSIHKRPLKYKDLDIFIRYGQALSILTKVMNAVGDQTFDTVVSSRKPFGLSTDFSKTDAFHQSDVGLRKPVSCYAKGKTIGYVEFNDIPAHVEWVDRIKVFVPRANNIGTELNDDNLNAFVARENTICTESYIAIGGDLCMTMNQATNMSNYLRTRFARFMHSLAKVSQDATAKTYRFVPLLDMNKVWTDELLYARFSLTHEEIDFIESTIKPMDTIESNQ